MSSKKQPPKQESPGAALVRLRWAKATDADRVKVGEQLRKSRKKIDPERRKAIAEKAAAARWAKKRGKKHKDNRS